MEIRASRIKDNGAQAGRPLPWGGNYSPGKSVSVREYKRSDKYYPTNMALVLESCRDWDHMITLISSLRTPEPQHIQYIPVW
jgi:hypothetical protein